MGIVNAVILLLFSNSAFSQEFPVLKGPYFGQKLPGKVPEIFAPGIISSKEDRELGGCTFSPDGKEFYFSRADNIWILMVSILESEGWTSPEPVKFTGGYSALEPHITYDNRRIFWVWRGLKDKGMYMAERTFDGWSEPRYVGPGMMVSSTRDGQMYVTNLLDEKINARIDNVRFENGRFTEYLRLKGEIEQFQNENRSAHPCISPDGSYMIFDKNGTYMYVSFKNKDNEWGKPIDLTKHGFDPKAGIASLSPDGKYLFFGMTGDIYWVDAKVIEELKQAQ
ncbi:hypothetical protein ACFL4T_11175 [candidate division KSB1 bacterium]